MELKELAQKRREVKAIEKSDRSVEELKDRYYSVAKAVLESRNQKNHAIVKQPYNFEYEVRRKTNLEKIFMRSKEQQEREKQQIASLKNTEAKIKKLEKEERNLARLKDNDFRESRNFQTNPNMKVSGVMLLSNRFQTKLPVPEPMQLQIEQTLKTLKINPAELHHSEKVINEFEQLRELLLTYFIYDKFITEKQDDLGIVADQKKELDALKMVYDMSAQA